MKYCIFFLLFSVFAYSQNDTIQLLEEVKLYGNFSPKINTGFQVSILSDSVINKQQLSLGTLLQNKANLYFKQHGNAMVSSISLRGTGASHTGVYWNGIAINSTLNGQTDFNTLSANGYNQIEIKKGSGSTLLGSGAIGGAINLRDKITFYSKKELNLKFDIASYNTQQLFIKTRWSSKKLYAKISLEGAKSDNDFPFLNTNLVNENGAYKNQHLKTVFGYKINTNNQLHLFSVFSNNDREFSRTLTAPSNSKYENKETKILLQWKNFGVKHNSSLKLAFLQENYNYFFNKTKPNHSFGKSINYIVKYDLNYFINKKTSMHSGLENRYIKGNGTNILVKEQNNLEAYLLVQQEPIEKLNYTLSLRKEISSKYKIPLIYTAAIAYDVISKLSIRANYATNYKLPTFNDLYWNPGGNENLLAEYSKATEIGIDFKTKKLKISATTFLINSKNLIQWRPFTNSIWQPINIQNTTSYGLELDYNTTFRINKQQFYVNLNYAYTSSTDKNLDKQLIYVPFHKANLQLNYTYKGWQLNLNPQFNGSVFTTTSNTQKVASYWLSNISINKSIFKHTINIGFNINNLFNTSYQNVSYRPMPNRNYNFNITIKL